MLEDFKIEKIILQELLNGGKCYMDVKLKKIIKVFMEKEYRYECLNSHGFSKFISSEALLKMRYFSRFQKELNLETPKTYTEKLQWLKLYDHKDIYTIMVDKYEAKRYVAQQIGEEYVIPLLGVWERSEDICFDELPEQFVLKTTHDSGGYVICTDKNVLDQEHTKEKLKRLLSKNYYVGSREWPYKNVKPRIIAEPYMEDKADGELRDYKFFTFNGVPKVLYITQARGKDQETVADFYDMEFKHLPFVIDHATAEIPPHPPKNFELMKKLAARLSEGTPQLRVDFYEVNGKVYFGEMTFFHCSGLEAFHPSEWDKIFGDWLVLPEKSI